jgi:hypothetical protein
MTGLRKHPLQSQLALFAGDELGWMETWAVRRHLLACAGCRRQVADFSQDRQVVRDLSAELPAGVDWERLSGEMAGNIRVGLAAGEAISAFDPPADLKTVRTRPVWFQWNAGWAVAAASVVFAAGFWINLPRPQAEHLLTSLRSIRFERIGRIGLVHVGKVPQSDSGNAGNDVLMEASRASIEVWGNGASLSLLNPRSDGPTISVSTQGSAGARYIDPDTGQVTINQVYYAPQ